MVVASAALAGCGGSEEPRLSDVAAAALHRDVAGVREAAAAGDRDGALEALDALAARVRREREAGTLSAAEARALRRGIDRARERVRIEVAEPQPTPESTPEPVAPEEDGEEGEEEGDDGEGAVPPPEEGNGKGRAKGKAKGPKGKGGD